MSKVKVIFAAMSVLVVLSGCTSYRESVEARMQGKTSEEKRAILADECRNEIAKGLKEKYPSDARHVQAMRQICEELTGQKVDVAPPVSGSIK